MKDFHLKDPGSAITHGIAAIMAIIGAIPLLIRVSHAGALHIFSFSIFIFTMIMLYTASTIYHSVDASETINRRLRKTDHMMISIMIAGSYTPICLITLHGKLGYILCGIVWAVAIVGILLKAFWITCPKWVSSVLYIGMGWLCVLAFVPLFHRLPRAGFIWLLAGGIIYTIGGIIYGLKLSFFDNKHKNFGSHEIFHLFVMGGSICHYIVMFCYIAPTVI